jgi:hypothetical protein
MTTTTTPRRGRRGAALLAIGLAVGSGAAGAGMPSPASAHSRPCVLNYPVSSARIAAARQCLATRTTPVRSVQMTSRGIRWI